MDAVINVGLLKNPFNWIIVALMILLFWTGFEIVVNRFSSEKD